MVTDNSDNKTSNNAASSSRQPRHRSNGFSTQLSINGVITSAPTASPDHHVNQSHPKLFQDAAPPKHKLTLPIVALMAVLRIAAKTTNLKTSMARWKGLPNPTKRRTRYTAVIASKGFPIEIPAAVARETSVISELAIRAPSRTPGAER